jgi:hypothetical protein
MACMHSGIMRVMNRHDTVCWQKSTPRPVADAMELKIVPVAAACSTPEHDLCPRLLVSSAEQMFCQ